jgi:hypothetical protein
MQQTGEKITGSPYGVKGASDIKKSMSWGAIAMTSLTQHRPSHADKIAEGTERKLHASLATTPIWSWTNSQGPGENGKLISHPAPDESTDEWNRYPDCPPLARPSQLQTAGQEFPNYFGFELAFPTSIPAPLAAVATTSRSSCSLSYFDLSCLASRNEYPRFTFLSVGQDKLPDLTAPAI